MKKLAVLILVLFSALASRAETPEYLASFDPAKGFKPAQRNLTEIYLQLAGSLEATGSPELYLRHVAAEHSRIENLYRQKTGKEGMSFRPPYMTDAYVDKLVANWNLLSPKIGLDPYAKQFGHMMRDAINGTRGTGTIIIDIFNHHQQVVFDSFTGKTKKLPGFETLRAELITRLELDKSSVDENRYAIDHRDAVSYAVIIKGMTLKLFDKLDSGLKPEAAERVKAFLMNVIADCGTMTQSELEAGITEWAFSNPSTATR